MTLVPPNWNDISDNENGRLISERLGQVFEQTIEYYQRQPELKPGELIAASNIQANIYTAKNPFAQLLARETFQRFKAHQDFEQTIYQWLALDNIQHQLIHEPVCRVTPIAHMTVLKDFLALFANEYNAALFRCLRSLHLSIEPEILEPGQKTLLPLDSREDLVDTECVHFALLGLYENSKTDVVTVLTCDDPEKLRMRLKIGRHIFELFSEDILETVLPRLGISLPPLAPGRVIFCDMNSPRIVEEIAVDELDRKIEIPEKAA